MKPASQALINLINAWSPINPVTYWDCYTITLFGGGQMFFTTAPFDISFGGTTWSSKLVRIDQKTSKVLAHWKTGLDNDTWVVVLMPRQFDQITNTAFPDKIGSVPWIQAARSGALENATVLVQRAYFAGMPTLPLPAGVAVPVGLLTIFYGLMGEVDTTDTMVVLTINDFRVLLQTQMPYRLYRASCQHTLFDADCNHDGNMNAAAFANAGTALVGSTQGLIVTSLGRPAGSGTYSLGRVQMTSGLNAGFWRMIANWDGVSSFSLTNPFPFTIAAGVDTFTAYPGCDKQEPTCTAFGNHANFDGEPDIPSPELAL
jgi:uncharacterized protein/uncharacterized protein DUF2163